MCHLICSYCHIGSRASQCLFHLIHGHSHAHWCLSVLFLLSFDFLPKFLFHLFLLLAMVPNDSMNNPCATPQSGASSPLTIAHPTHHQKVIEEPFFLFAYGSQGSHTKTYVLATECHNARTPRLPPQHHPSTSHESRWV